MELDLKKIKEDMKNGNFNEALGALISLANGDNFSSLPEILEGIFEIQKKGFNLTEQQIQNLKALFKTYDENVQELTLNIITTNLKNKVNSLYKEIETFISDYKIIEPPVRIKFINFLIEHFYEYYDNEKELVHNLILCLGDDIWDIRKKVIEFLNDIFLDRPNFIKMFDKDLEILYNEKDIDVKREGLDLLLRIFLKTYDVEDVKKLVESIPNRNWTAQENIIMLISKIGIEKPNLIQPIAKDLVSLLDYYDYLVVNAVNNAVEGIMDYHNNIFDDLFYSLIETGEIDNLEIIENLLRISVIKNGYKRFIEIFNRITINSKPLIKVLINLIKKINTVNPKLIETILSQSIPEFLKDHNNDLKKLKLILEPNPLYNVYAACFKTLNNLNIIGNSQIKERKLEMLDFLKEKIPELRFLNIKNWLETKLRERPVSIDEVFDRFQIEKSIIINLLNKFKEDDDFNIVISNNLIILKIKESDSEKDLLFLKKWEVNQDPKVNKYEIILYVQIKNVSGKDIKNLNINLEYPKEFFIYEEKNQETYPKLLLNNENLILTYIFEKQSEIINTSYTDSIKVIVSYVKEDKRINFEKKLDFLLA